MPLNPKSIKSNPSIDGFATIVYGDSGSGKTTLMDMLPVKKRS
jgi:ABC-type lipoprotein export system ATPase subunit